VVVRLETDPDLLALCVGHQIRVVSVVPGRVITA
jgi:hypothetical protein